MRYFRGSCHRLQILRSADSSTCSVLFISALCDALFRLDVVIVTANKQEIIIIYLLFIIISSSIVVVVVVDDDGVGGGGGGVCRLSLW